MMVQARHGPGEAQPGFRPVPARAVGNGNLRDKLPSCGTIAGSLALGFPSSLHHHLSPAVFLDFFPNHRPPL